MSDFLNCAIDEPAASPALADNQEFAAFVLPPALPALSDKTGLSETRHDAVHGSPANCQTADDLVAEYMDAARAPNTRRAYERDLKDFEAWGGTLPSTPDKIARYLALRAGALRSSTLHRRLAAIASAHRDRGLADPTKAPMVRRVLQGIERKHGTAITQAAPLLITDLVRIIAAMGQSLMDLRDRAVLLAGFFGALRRSEIAALDVCSIAKTSDGMALLIARSKTDQAGHGRVVHLYARPDAFCPVAAIEDWLAASGIREGAVFRAVEGGTSIGRLSGRTIAEIVKKRVAAAGLPADRYSGHSLRAGFATSAALAGFDAILIARQTGHHSQQMVASYVRLERDRFRLKHIRRS